MTAEEIFPVLINASSSMISELDSVEIFSGISYWEAFVSLFALSIVLDIVIWLRTRGSDGMPDLWDDGSPNMGVYHRRFGRGRR